MIALDHITVDFGGLRAVDDVSFEIPKDRITGLIGPNGAGKTTLFNAIAGHVRPSSGRVLLEGEDITRLKPHQRAGRGLARTFQIPQEFSRLTALENLMAATSAPLGENVLNVIFGRGRYLSEERSIFIRARETIAFLDLDRVADEKAGNLSGGQKKLLELGRALMREPRIVLLDEIGAGINRTLLARIADKIKLLNRERSLTFCLIEHDLDYVSKLCDDVVVMAQGAVLARGSVEQLRKDERVIEAYFGGGKYESRA
ncbi:MAG: ABC transporter ATP-binding protein [Hyphomicrobiales bacterium]